MLRLGTIGRLILTTAPLLLLLAALSACSQSPTPTPASMPDMHEHDHSAMPGVVSPPPPGATQVKVTLGEWTVAPSPRTVPAGLIYFLVENRGLEHPHELVVAKTDLDSNQLSHIAGVVEESKVEIIGRIEEFAINSTASGVMNLSPGNYALFCNLTELTDKELDSHYLMGMHTSFTVQ